MYESNTVLNVAHNLFIACFFCRVRQHSLPTNLINGLYICKVSTVKWPFGVNLMNVQLCQKLLPLLAIPAVMLKGALPLFSPLEDGPFMAGMGYVGIRHTYGLYQACSKVRELQTLTVSVQHLLMFKLS